MAREYTAGSYFKKNRRWYGKVSYKDDDGKRRTRMRALVDKNGDPIPDDDANDAKAKKAFTTWRDTLQEQDRIEAERAAAKAEAEAEAEAEQCDPKTVAEYVAEYIDFKALMYDPDNRGAKDIEPSTAYTYRKLNERIAAGFPGVPIESLKYADVKKWVERMSREGISASMIRKCVVLLKSACKEAVKEDILAKNPCEGVPIPKVAPREKNTLDEPTVAMLNEMLDRQGHTKMADAARIALHTGMRVGEICGLRWMDVDLNAETITVQNAIGYSTRGGYEKAPKSGKARVIPIDADLLQTLTERRDIVRDQCDELEIAFSKRMFVLGDVVAPDDVRGSHANPGTISKLWGDFAQAVGLRGVTGARPTFHDLRHTYATIAVRHQNDIESVAAILGHRDVSMTLNTYATALPEAVKQTTERMGEIMGRRAPANKVLEMPATGTDGGN